MIVSRYWLPPPPWKPKGKPYPSPHMTAEDAKARGLKPEDIVPGSEEDRPHIGMQSAGMDGPRKG